MNKKSNSGKSKNVLRLRGRGRLLTLIERPEVLTRLNVAPDGRLVAETQDWECFWASVRELSDPQIERALLRLHGVWREYIGSRFERSLQREYCLRYFSLLDLLLAMLVEQRASHSWKRALRTVVGFECFAISSLADDQETLAAGTTTVRNPSYLLAKLKWPDAVDDSRFLPLVEPADGEAARLYYHYRQYRLAKDSPASVLLYVAVSSDKRAASFEVIEALAPGISAGADPRHMERAQRLWSKVLRPLIRSRFAESVDPVPIELVDVGAGSGVLTAALCRKLLAWSVDKGLSRALRVWFVDLCPADPARFFRDAHMREGTDSLAFVGVDYRRWLAQPGPLPTRSGLRIGLVSKLLNNMSCFTLSKVSTNVLSSFISPAALKEGSHLPASCLASDGAGPQALSISNSRIELAGGRTFAQASLAPYYRALHVALTDGLDDRATMDEIRLPLRTFDRECLVAANGTSVLARLLDQCDYVVIEDADLRPDELIEHLRSFSLHHSAVLDMTRTLGLVGNQAYLIWADRDARPALAGEQIW
jgi:hypothetical protein